MQVPSPRWLVALAAFLSPALVVVLTAALGSLPRANTSALEGWVQPVFVGAILLAAIVPAVTIMTSRLPLYGRLCLIVGFWCGLFVEVYLAFGWAFGGHRPIEESNHSIQRTGASRSAQSVFLARGRPAPAADAERSVTSFRW